MKRIFLFFIFLLNLNLYSDELTSPKYIFLSVGENQIPADPLLTLLPLTFAANMSTNAYGPLTENNTIFSLGAGFDVGNNLLEISYIDYGRDVSSGYFADEYSLVQFNNVMESSFSEKITGYLKFGISYLNINSKTATVPPGLSFRVDLQPTKQKLELVYGLGINFDVKESYSVFLEFMDSGHNITSSYSLGVKFFLNK